MEPLKKYLTRKRVSKSNLTKLKGKIENCIDSADVAQIELFKSETKETSERFNDIFDAIFELCNEDEVETFIAESEEVRETIHELNLLILRAGERLSSGSAKSNESGLKTEAVDLKLPKLSLPVFSGNLDEWLSFVDLFQACIANNEKLSGAQKLQYLKGSLRGDALKIVQSIPVTDSNFRIAWELLCERYSNKRELIFSLIRKFMGLPALNSENPVHILNLVDSTKECIRLLESLEQRVENFSDTFLVYIVQSKLDSATRGWWERSLKDDDIPNVEQLLEFLRNHARTLQPYKAPSAKRQVSRVASFASNLQPQCICCGGSHIIFKCEKFSNLPVEKRVNLAKHNNLCFNCLSQAHRARECKSVNTCRRCKKLHHTLLHFERAEGAERQEPEKSNVSRERSMLSVDAKEFSPNRTAQKPRAIEGSERSVDSVASTSFPANSHLSSTVASCLTDFNLQQQVLLCTALVKVRDSSGDFQICRALLDPGSQASFITESCISRLGLARRRAKVYVSCLSSSGTHTNGVTEIQFTPHFSSNPTFTTSAFVISKIIGNLPRHSLQSGVVEGFRDITLADPTFFKSGPIDILLGVSVSLPMFKGETIFEEEGMPFAVSSELGWVVSGTLTFPTEDSSILVNNIQLETDSLIRKFWELENVPTANLTTKEEDACESHFLDTHSRDEQGRYVVKLPFRDSPTQLGDSRQLAAHRFKCLEKKFLSDEEMHKEYRRFMDEYHVLGHMEKVPTPEKPEVSSTTFYLPHHAVVKASSTTTKLRVVFDASAKSSSGISLNDILMVGPRIQQELFPVLLRFRTFPIAICADVEKMFRQIKVHSEDTDFQRILWRDNPEDPVAEFRLLTVTYGTASAPFLATRTLNQLALDEEEDFPVASKVTLRDFYVDDLLTGAETVNEAHELTKQLSEMMDRGGFTLRKWSSNIPKVLEGIPEEFRESNFPLQIRSDDAVKVLGINWHPCSDSFDFSVSVKKPTEFTKRNILSEIARIFDPMGWLAPCVIFGKIFLQELWKHDLSWDESIGESSKKWKTFHDELALLSEVKITRYALVPEPRSIQVHAFSDASESAYCAVIYIRSVSHDSNVKVSLLAAKTRVAPLKMQSIPRLELCAALLLANLLEVVLKYLQLPIQDSFAWTDSKVALAWISSEPRRWQTFVANRVAKIQEAVPNLQWSHVQGKENPADCGTRGLLPSELLKCELWFQGPDWLREPNFVQPANANFDLLSEDALKEARKDLVTTVVQLEETRIINKFSSWLKLCRVIAWCLRFTHNCSKESSQRVKGFLSTEELNKAVTTITKIVQKSQFSEELSCLKAGKPVKTNSRAFSLYPILDDAGVIRVGGRLRNASISEDQRHPILLPKSDHITELIIKHVHETHFHGGPELVLSVIRQRFWILSGRDAVRKVIRRCITCCRHRAETSTQLMADLPKSRVQQARPFSHVGVDFAGPFLVKPLKGRGNRTVKCYVCLFICFSTRAIHLEVVGDLSSKAFLASLKRFIARRGKPSEIFSDCGTNFVGADRELKKFASTFQRNENVDGFLTSENIKWTFNPPCAPHFGGLWEAGVKSMKYWRTEETNN